MISQNTSQAILPDAARAAGNWPTGIVAEAIARRRGTAPAPATHGEKLPGKVYAIMAATSLVTFGTVTAVYELFFNTPLIA